MGWSSGDWNDRREERQEEIRAGGSRLNEDGAVMQRNGSRLGGMDGGCERNGREGSESTKTPR